MTFFDNTLNFKAAVYFYGISISKKFLHLVPAVFRIVYIGKYFYIACEFLKILFM